MAAREVRSAPLGHQVERHADAVAVAILAELGGLVAAPGERWGVWAAEPPGPGD
ncbi:hypothetical protein [Streptomyces sp. NPDC056132]|uniref:hypothetical protein n=1 Tax=Streptomyces sp. NPDC056132 TaxID=3345722 RepID=UPI0035E065A7